MKKTVAVIQSNYIPWKGYFDIIHDVDEFVFYDDVQYTKRDWRSRNLIKTPQGTKWLTIPVGSDVDRLICEVQIKDSTWQSAHWRLIEQHYSAAPFFSVYKSFFEDVYLSQKWENLSALNQFLICQISRNFLGITTSFRDSRELAAEGRKLDRMLDVLKKAGATRYISGPAAKAYLAPEQFEAAGIELVWKDYSDYPQYSQFHPPFTHGVSILDLLFHAGSSASEFIWGHRRTKQEQVNSEAGAVV